MALCTAAIISIPSSAQAQWAVGQVRIVGAGLTVSPSRQAIQVGVPTVVNTSFGGSAVPLGYVVRAELSGPAFAEDQALSAVPNSPFQIPALVVQGAYYLKNIRLMNGDTFIASANPSQVEIDASNILITQVTSRPMTWEEIQAAGIVLNTNDYKVYRYTVGLGLESGTVLLDFPVLFSKSDPTRPPIVLNRLGLPGPPPLPNVLPPGPGGTSCGLKCEDGDGDDDLEPVEIDFPDDPAPEGLNLSGLLVFPNRITFLNQFFVVALLLQNGAPTGSSLTLDQVTSTIHLPDGSEFVLRQTNPPAVNGAVPVLNPGPDGTLGTADDVSLLSATMQGQSEFDVTTPKAGTYTVDIEFHGTLGGLPSGQPVAVSGHAKGVVVVRDPTFHVTFAHPAVVRQNEEYTLKVTLSNTSTAVANDVSLGLPSGQISGAALLTGQSDVVPLGTLGPGQSKTAEFRLVALKTGRVTVTSAAGTGGTTGTIVLTLGVGDGHIPLSPDTLILPPIVNAELPDDVVNAALDFLGIGWSLATAPPNSRPPNMAPVSEAHVRYRAGELTTVARFLAIAHSPAYPQESALAELALRWLGNGVKNDAWDSLRRLPPDEYGPSKGQQLAQTLGPHLLAQGQGVLDGHQAFVQAASVLDPHFSAALDPTNATPAPKLWIEDGNRKQLGDGDNGLVRNIPWGEHYPFGNGRLLVIGRLDGTESFTVHVDGQGEGTFDLSVAAPLSGGMTIARFAAVPTAAGAKARVVFAPGSDHLVLENDLSGSGFYAPLEPSSSSVIALPPLQPLGAYQDLMADQAGRAAAVFFNRPVDKASAETYTNYSLNTREIIGAYLQGDERVVEARAQSRISPLALNNLTITGVKAKDQSDMVPPSVTLPVLTTLTRPGGTVNGIVYDEDGMPLVGAPVYLWEWDDDLLKESSNALELPDPVHVTQYRTTGSDGKFTFDYVMVSGHCFTIDVQKPGTNYTAKLMGMITMPNQTLEVSLFMRGRGSLVGTVFAADGTPAARALVTATETSTNEYGQAFTDEHGSYRIDKLPVGTLSVQAIAAGGPHAEGSARIGQAGDIVSLNLSLVTAPTGGVKGVVKASDGTPLGGAAVGLGISGFIQTSVFTEADGSFIISGVPAAAYALFVYEPVTFKPRIQMAITITGGAVLDVHDLILPTQQTGAGTVTGHFFISDGVTPVPGGSVFVTTNGGAVIARTQSDSSGAFTLSGIPLGSFTLNGYDPATRRSTQATGTIAFDGQSVGANLYLPAFGTIQGTVYKYVQGGAKAPASFVEVHMGAPGTDSERVLMTDSQGHYQFAGVGLGEQGLIAYVSSGGGDVGYASAWVTFDGQTVTQDIQLIGRGDLSVHTMIRGTNGQPDQDVGALINVFTCTIDPKTLKLEPDIKSGYSDATSGIATFKGLLGLSTRATATNGFNGSGGGSVVVAPGKSTVLSLYLDPTGSVVGHVVAQDGVTAVPHAIMTLQISGMPDRTIAADSDGNYELELVAKGARVTVMAQDPVSGRRGIATGVLSDPNVPLRLDVTLWGLGRVEGLVLEDDGHGQMIPAVNSSVTLRGAYPHGTLTATTDSLGQFALDGVEEGAYSVEALDQSHSFELAGKGNVAVAKNETAQVTITLGSFGVVEGTLVMPDGVTPVQNVQVVLNNSNSISFSLTDSGGRFVFNYVPVGQDFTLDAVDQRTGRSAHGTARITAPDQVLEVPLELTAIGKIYGTVSNHAGTTAIAHPQVAASGGGVYGIQTTGGADGKYEFSGLPEGQYMLQATDPANGAMATGQGTLTGEGTQLEVNLNMPAFGSVAGTVYRPDGVTPVSGAFVSLDPHHNIATDSNGQFRFDGVGMGSYWVKAQDPLSRDGGKQQVILTEDGQAVSATITYVGLGTVRGVVVDASNNPVEGFQVTLHDTNGYTGNEGAGPVGTAADGGFEFINQRVGHVVATAVAPQGSNDKRVGSAEGELASDGATLDLIVHLGAAGTVRGTLVDESGSAFAGAQVTLRKTATGETRYAGSDSNGRFNFAVVPIGDQQNGGAFTLAIVGPNNHGHANASGALTQDGQILDMGTIQVDTIPPAVSTSVPADQAVNVARNVAISITFSEPIDVTTINSLNEKLLNDSTGATVPASFALSQDGLVLTIAPSQPLSDSTTYKVWLSQKLRDISGNEMAADATIRFTTIDDVPPHVAEAYPANGAVQIPGEVVPFVLFSEPIDDASLTSGTFTLASGSGPVTGAVSHPEPNKLLFLPDHTLYPNVVYTMNVAGYKDLAGNIMVPWSSSFATVDTVPPTISLVAASEAEAGQTAHVTISAADSTSLGKVNYSVTGAITLNGEHNFAFGTTTGEYDLAIPVPTAVADGAQFQVAATVTDASGQSTSASPVAVAVYHQPSVSLTAPLANAVLPHRGLVKVVAQVPSYNWNLAVKFLLDGMEKATVSQPPYEAWVAMPDSGAQSILSATALTGLGKSATSAPVMVNLCSSAMIQGHVFNAGGQMPSPNAIVTVHYGLISGQTVATISAGSDGAFVSNYIPLGPYVLEAHKADGTDAGVASANLSVDGVTVQTDVTLVGTGTVSGKLVDAASGLALAGANVTLDESSVISRHRELQTAADGSFVFSNTLAGSFTLKAYHPVSGRLGATQLNTLSPGGSIVYNPLRCYQDAAFVTAFTPVNGSTGIDPATVTISVTFSQPVNASTLSSGIIVENRALPFDTTYYRLSGTWTVTDNQDGTSTAVFSYDNSFLAGHVYRIRVSSVQAVSGSYVMYAEGSFTTRTPPVPLTVQFFDRDSGTLLGETTPQQDSRGVAPNSKIAVIFDQAIDPATVADGRLLLRPTTGSALGGTVSLLEDGKTLEYLPSQPIPADSLYNLVLTGGLANPGGDSWSQEMKLSSLYTVDTQPPASLIVTPPDQGYVLEASSYLPVRVHISDGSNYCAPVTANLSVNGAQKAAWGASSCADEIHGIAMPASGGQPYQISLSALDQVGHSASTTVQLNPVAVQYGPSTPLAGSIYCLAASADGRVYVAQYQQAYVVGIYQLDQTGHSSPTLLGTIPLANYPIAIGVSGSQLWVLFNSSLKGFDVTNPSSPAPLAEVSLAGCGSGCYATSLALGPGYAYVGDNANGYAGYVHVIALDNPSAPVEVKRFSLGAPIRSMQVEGTQLAVLTTSYSWYYGYGYYMSMYSLSDPKNPAYERTIWNISDCRLEGSRAYVRYASVSSLDNMAILDISNPNSPVQLGQGYASSNISPSVRDGGFLLLASGSLSVIRVGEPSLPYSAGSISQPGASYIAQTGNVAAAVIYSQGTNQLATVAMGVQHHGTSLQILEPAGGTVVSARSVLTVKAQPNPEFDGVVTLLENGKPVDAQDHAPYEFKRWVPCSGAQSITYQASLRDDSGQEILSDAVQVQIPQCDQAPLLVQATNPSDQATGVERGSTLSATFNKPLDPASVSGSTVMVLQGTTAVAAQVTLSADGMMVSLTPTWPLAPSTVFTFKLSGSIQDTNGIYLGHDIAVGFTTTAARPLQITQTVPVDQDQNVEPGQTGLRATFSTPIDPRTLDWQSATLTRVSDGGIIYEGASLDPDGRTLVCTPSLEGLTAYTWTINTTIHDLSGDTLAAPVVVNFTTKALALTASLGGLQSGQFLMGGDTQVYMSASGSQPITGMELLLDGQPVPGGLASCPPPGPESMAKRKAVGPGTKDESFYQCGILPALNRPFGSTVTLTARATDASGNTALSAPVEAKVFGDAISSGSWTLPASDGDIIALSADKAATSSDTTKIYDLNNPDAPILEVQRSCYKLAWYGDVLLGVADDPLSFTPVPAPGAGGVVVLQGSALAVDGSMAATISGSNLVLYDLGDAQHPRLLASHDISQDFQAAGITDVWLGGDRVIVEAYAGGGESISYNLLAYDVGRPSSALFMGRQDMAYHVVDKAFFNKANFITVTGNNMVIWDVSGQGAPVQTGTYCCALEPFHGLGDHYLVATEWTEGGGGVAQILDTANLEDIRQIYSSGPVLSNIAVAESVAGEGGEVLTAKRVYSETTGVTWGVSHVSLHFNDTEVPSIQITSPPAAPAVVDTSKGWWRLDVAASDNVGIATLELKINGVTAQRRTHAPWYFFVPVTAGMLNQSVTAEVVAADLSGNTATDSRILRFNDAAAYVSLAPNGSVTVPAGGELIITADALLAGGVDRVDISVDGTVVAQLTERPYQYVFAPAASMAGRTVAIDATAYNGATSLSTAGTPGSLSVQVVEPAPNMLLRTIGTGSPCPLYYLQLSTDGAMTLAGSDCGYQLYNTADWSQPLRTMPDPWAFLRPDGDTLALGDDSHWEVQDAVSGTTLRSIAVENTTNSAAISPDGNTMAAFDNNQQLALLHLDTGIVETCCALTDPSLSLNAPWADSSVCLPDGRRLAVMAGESDGAGGWDYHLLILDLSSKQWMLNLPLPDRGNILAGPDNDSIWLLPWNGNTAYVVRISDQQTGAVTGLPADYGVQASAVHPGGGFVTATAQYQGGFQMFDISNSFPPTLVEGHTSACPDIWNLTFTPSGKRLLAVNGTTQIYEYFVASADIWPPKLVASMPSDGGTVAPGGPVICYLSEPMDISTISGATVTAVSQPDGAPVAGSVASAHAGTVVTWTPAQPLAAGGYKLTLGGLKDLAGNQLPEKSITFVVQ
jgi:hypothetical protein